MKHKWIVQLSLIFLNRFHLILHLSNNRIEMSNDDVAVVYYNQI